jgi:hypothetical protein
MAKRTRNAVEEMMAKASVKLRRAARREGYALTEAESDLLTAAGFAALARVYGEPAGIPAAEVDSIVKGFEASVKHCAGRVKRDPAARLPFEARA